MRSMFERLWASWTHCWVIRLSSIKTSARKRIFSWATEKNPSQPRVGKSSYPAAIGRLGNRTSKLWRPPKKRGQKIEWWQSAITVPWQLASVSKGASRRISYEHQANSKHFRAVSSHQWNWEQMVLASHLSDPCGCGSHSLSPSSSLNATYRSTCSASCSCSSNARSASQEHPWPTISWSFQNKWICITTTLPRGRSKM